MLLHRYDFNNQGATDSIGGCEYEGTLEAGAVVDGGQVFMTANGITGGYVDIPSNVFEGYASITIEVWFTTGYNTGYARIFQYGSSDENYNSIALCRSEGDGEIVLQYGTVNGLYDVFPPLAFNDLTDCYAVVTVTEGSFAQLYINGTLIGGTSIYVNPFPSADVFFIGKSLDDNDVGFTGSVNEFRIWGGILPQKNITQNFLAGPSKCFG